MTTDPDAERTSVGSVGATPSTDQPPARALLNGAQIQSVLELLNAVSAGEIPRESAINTMVGGLGLSTQQAESMMGEIGRSFVSSEIKNAEPPTEVPTTQTDWKKDNLYQNIDFSVPQEVTDALAIGLQHVAQYFPEFSTAPLVNEARDLLNGCSIGPMQVVEWCAYFNRTPAPDATERNMPPTKALMVWNLHGGDWGSTWCTELRHKMKVEEAKGGNVL